MAEDKIVLGDAAWKFGLSSFVLGHFFFLGVGLGLSIKWAGVAKLFDPTVLMGDNEMREEEKEVIQGLGTRLVQARYLFKGYV